MLQLPEDAAEETQSAAGIAFSDRDTAQEQAQIDRVEIYHDAGNTASGRVPAKLGYARLGERPTRDLGERAPADTGTEVLWRRTG